MPKKILEVYPADIICDEWLDRPTAKKFIGQDYTHVQLGRKLKTWK